MNAVSDVLLGTAKWGVDSSDALAFLRSLPVAIVSLVFFSPPYEAQRTYGISFRRQGQDWVDWMRSIIVQSARVSSGLVVVNAAGPVLRHRYSPALEWLVADLTRLDGLVCGPAPYAWVKSENHEDARPYSLPGSGGRHYQRRDWEALYTFAIPDRLPLAWSDNIAFGLPPVYGPGGEMSNRTADGTRCNDPWGKQGRGNGLSGRQANGAKNLGKRLTWRAPRAGGDVMVEQTYVPPAISNPGNVIRAPVGGGKLGSPLAHAGEAPMTLALAERFVCWFVPPGGVVLDPFCGTGTTLHAALEHGRRGIGCDIRESQCDFTRRRMARVTPPLFVDAT